MKRWFSAVVMVGLVVGATRSAQADKDRYEPGEEVPTFTLRAVNGDIVGDTYISIDRYFGPSAKDPRKAVLLSFFATYCEPCKREIPLLAALHDTYKAKGLQVVLVSIDTEADKIDLAKELAKEAGVRFPVLSDRYNIVAKRYFVTKLPNSYLVDGQGRVAMANVGYNEDISKRLLDEIRKAIGEPAGEPIPELVSRHMGKVGVPEVVPVKGEMPVAAEAVAPSPEVEAETETAAVEDTAPAKGKAKGKGKGKKKAKAR